MPIPMGECNPYKSVLSQSDNTRLETGHFQNNNANPEWHQW